MKKSTDIRTGRHCVFKLHVHLVFVTKYRASVFNDEILKDLETIFKEVCQTFDVGLVEMNGETEHIHLLLNYPPKVSISKLVNSLKGVSSRLIRKKHPELAKYYWKGGLWSPSYFAGSCGGAPLSIIKQYIEQQNRPF
jgi:putative transposase